jgi:hypothetical protein
MHDPANTSKYRDLFLNHPSADVVAAYALDMLEQMAAGRCAVCGNHPAFPVSDPSGGSCPATAELLQQLRASLDAPPPLA